KYYERVAPAPLLGQDALRDRDTRRVLASMGLVVFEQARAELAHALASEHVPDTLIAVRGRFRLSASAARELGREISALLGRWRERERKAPRKAKSYALTVALVPAEERSPSNP
ncbi:MAG TPA: hypothetical protein VL284_20090, partial [Thermoanaerobaculia bacterium]|nr:hypothetical protein [Thermoanaerobaculia bacterium]